MAPPVHSITISAGLIGHSLVGGIGITMIGNGYDECILPLRRLLHTTYIVAKAAVRIEDAIEIRIRMMLRRDIEWFMAGKCEEAVEVRFLFFLQSPTIVQ